MSFRPDRTKQAHEVIFFRKINKATRSPRSSHVKNSEASSSQKHLGVSLDTKLSFNEHTNGEIYQANKGATLLRKLQTILPRTSLLTIHNSFIIPPLDYADMIYDQPSNTSFSRRVTKIYLVCSKEDLQYQ